MSREKRWYVKRGWYALERPYGHATVPLWPTRWTRFKFWLRGRPLPKWER